ncbi:MAG: 4Fe-4S binding protein [Planctomycetota bacterium]|nr:4Fe-4S binding protein [Planctomycetota bacterium]
MSSAKPFQLNDSDFTYDFDEEAGGFGVPYEVPAHQRTHAAPGEDEDPADHAGPSLLLRASLGMVVVGVVALLLQVSTGKLLGSWGGLLLGLVLPSVGTALYFWERYRHLSAGIKNDGVFFSGTRNRGLIGWLVGVGMTAFYVALYWFPSYLGYTPAVWDEYGMVSDVQVSGLTLLVDPLARLMTGAPADHWFAYTVLYTLAVVVFGVRMMMRYRNNPYQLIRTASVMFFQTGLAFVLPKLLKSFQQPEFYPTYFWPLKRDVLLPGDYGMNWTATEAAGQVGVWMLVFAGAMTFLATPVLTYLYGKRWYCSWVCGCGGLAETLGDPWRHLSDKSTRAWWIERIVIYSVLAVIVFLTGLLWLNHVRGGELLGGFGASLERHYGFWIGSMFAGVAGVGFYPLLGSRVWCRFGCPQAAILGILQRFLSRFRITTNGGQCISCGNCSTYCEMGIDVRAYAQRGENIVRASCVGCGVCAAVCPRGVLKLENGAGVLEEQRYTS